MDKLLNQTIDQVHFYIYSQETNLLPALEFKPMTHLLRGVWFSAELQKLLELTAT